MIGSMSVAESTNASATESATENTTTATENASTATETATGAGTVSAANVTTTAERMMTGAMGGARAGKTGNADRTQRRRPRLHGLRAP